MNARLGCIMWPSPPPLPLVLRIFLLVSVDLRIIPHFSNNGSLPAKEVAEGWGWGRDWVESCGVV